MYVPVRLRADDGVRLVAVQPDGGCRRVILKLPPGAAISSPRWLP